MSLANTDFVETIVELRAAFRFLLPISPNCFKRTLPRISLCKSKAQNYAICIISRTNFYTCRANVLLEHTKDLIHSVVLFSPSLLGLF